MYIENFTPDAAVLSELGTRLKSLRLDKNITQAELAQRTGLSSKTVMRLEKGEDVQLSAFIKCLRALNVLSLLESALPERQPRPSDYLHATTERKRASKKPNKTDRSLADGSAADGWKWGDEM